MSAIKDLTTPGYSEEDDLFFFETDHLALRGNNDYSEILKTLVVLQSQRLQAIKDYEEVAQLHKIALKDPIAFLEKLKGGEKLCPDMMQICEVRSVNWDKYKVKPPPNLLQQLDTDNQKEGFLNADSLKDKGGNTFNKAWTTEEQKRLEEFLIQFPPEPVEINRFKKIAAALGTRSVAQVTSRVQKYFLKLAKLGLPIPGRIPKSCAEKFKKCHPHQRFNHLLLRPSTFFPELDIPVKMDDTDIAPGPSNDNSEDKQLSNYLLPTTEAYLEHNSGVQSGGISKANENEVRLKLLKQIKEVKGLEEITEERDLYRHSEYTCDYCDEEPIIGARWHCYTCDNSDSIDYCTDCMISQIFSAEPHNISHEFITIGIPKDKKNSSNFVVPTHSDSESDVDSYHYDNILTDVRYESGTDNDNVRNAQEEDSDSESFQDNKQMEFGNLQIENQNENNELQEGNEGLDFRNVIVKQEYPDYDVL